MLIDGNGGRLKDVSIVGGGVSFRGHQNDWLPGRVVAVNDAAVHLKTEPYAVVTMDRLWTEYRWDKLCQLNKLTWIRVAALKNIKMWSKFPLVQPFDCDHTTCVPSPEAHVLNGTNSGACALSLVLKWRPERVWLFGFDMGRKPEADPYWYPPYPWAPRGGTKPGTYTKWVRQMAPLLQAFGDAGIKGYQVGYPSGLPGFEFLTYKEFGSSGAGL